MVLLLFTRVRAFPDTREWVVSPIPSAQLLHRCGAASAACKPDYYAHFSPMARLSSARARELPKVRMASGTAIDAHPSEA